MDERLTGDGEAVDALHIVQSRGRFVSMDRHRSSQPVPGSPSFSVASVVASPSVRPLGFAWQRARKGTQGAKRKTPHEQERPRGPRGRAGRIVSAEIQVRVWAEQPKAKRAGGTTRLSGSPGRADRVGNSPPVCPEVPIAPSAISFV
jgi:hypothetical protein